MNKMLIRENAKKICNNFNSVEGKFKLRICDNPKALADFYNTYNGVTEFLYVAPEQEISEAIDNGAIFYGIIHEDEIAGVAKISQLELPYPFFSVPKNMDKELDYWGLSGLYVHEKFRGKKLSTILLNAGTSLAQECGGAGIYADFDYRNVNSMRLISKYYNLLGYTDGRNGSPDEATIYTTFFKDFSGMSKNGGVLIVDFNDCDFSQARQSLDYTMSKIGNSSINKVNYCDGYNEIVCFDTPYIFDSSKIVIKDDKTSNKIIDR